MPIMAKLDREWGFALPVHFVCPANNLVVHNGCGLCSKHSLICPGAQKRGGDKNHLLYRKWHPIHIERQDLGRNINKKISDNQLIIRDFFVIPPGLEKKQSYPLSYSTKSCMPNLLPTNIYNLIKKINKQRNHNIKLCTSTTTIKQT